MSYCPQVRRVLQTLELTDAFDFVAGRDDVEHVGAAGMVQETVPGEHGTADLFCRRCSAQRKSQGSPQFSQ